MWYWISAFFPPRGPGQAPVSIHLWSVCSCNRSKWWHCGWQISRKAQYNFRFLRSARRLNPPTANLIPSWDLSVVLQALQGDPFEPLQSVELSALSIKMAFLTVLTSVKKVRDHPALSVNEMCLEFGPADSHIVLRPWPSYVLKVPTTLFRDQMVTWQALPPDEGDPALSLLCTVHAYSHTVYLDCTKSLRQSEQFFVRHIKSEVLEGHTQPGASLPLWP